MDAVVEQRYLLNEYKKAYNAETTRDCRKGCNGCFGARCREFCGRTEAL